MAKMIISIQFGRPESLEIELSPSHVLGLLGYNAEIVKCPKKPLWSIALRTSWASPIFFFFVLFRLACNWKPDHRKRRRSAVALNMHAEVREKITKYKYKWIQLTSIGGKRDDKWAHTHTISTCNFIMTLILCCCCCGFFGDNPVQLRLVIRNCHSTLFFAVEEPFIPHIPIPVWHRREPTDRPTDWWMNYKFIICAFLID